MTDAQQQITDIIKSYEKMLTLFLEKGEHFDSAPYTYSIQALNKLIDKETDD